MKGASQIGQERGSSSLMILSSKDNLFTAVTVSLNDVACFGSLSIKKH